MIRNFFKIICPNQIVNRYFYLLLRRIAFFFFFALTAGYSQEDSSRLSFNADFRFRMEEDWNSRKSDGSFRSDRTRFVYRFRAGLEFKLDAHSRFGARIRTGELPDQQGPHITLGSGTGEFGLAPIGLEKLYYGFTTKRLELLLGKNSIIARHEHEMFWNDNVYPEGVALRFIPLQSSGKGLQKIELNTAHYIVRSTGKGLNSDSYFQLIQGVVTLFDKRILLAPAIYHFSKVGNIPDGKHDFVLDYNIFHLGSAFEILKQPHLRFAVDYYSNMKSYDSHPDIPPSLKDEKTGYVLELKLGELRNPGDWSLQLYYAQLQKYAIVDYFSQNDWGRWDYADRGAYGSRLSNMKGFELRLSYLIKRNFNLVLRAYKLSQIKAEGAFAESGSRVRLDMNIGF